jgi:hypothetical protein
MHAKGECRLLAGLMALTFAVLASAWSLHGQESAAWKWRQPPDLSPQGFDVACRKDGVPPILLADDFLCTNRCAITNIVIWGSWFNDELPPGENGPDPTKVEFTLSFHADAPKGVQAPWSMPGQTLWVTNFLSGTFLVAKEAQDIVEGWYDPATSNYMPNADWTCWRYTFPLDPGMAFVQTGSVANAVIYWLDVQAKPLGDPTLYRFGWKTTLPLNRWNDDACWAPAIELVPGGFNGIWWDLHYPFQHEYAPESFDLAFALYGGPVGEEIDWGDAPDGPGAPGYLTLSINNGAWHAITNTLYLGVAIDGEADGQPNANATGDDIGGPTPPPGDEDGVFFTSGLFAGMPASIRVTAVGAGLLSAWLDGNRNGTWNPGEQVLADVPLAGGVTNLVFQVPPILAAPGASFMRFRYSTAAVLGVSGGAPDGEVEDYQVQITEGPAELDYGDAPTNAYPVLQSQNGARHGISALGVGNYTMGALIDADADGQPTAGADGDDKNGLDDEDGVIFPTNSAGQAFLIQGSNLTVKIVTPGAPWLTAWVDFNGDGDWNDVGERIASVVPLSAGTNGLAVTAPSLAFLGPTYARFRTSSLAVTLATTGAAPDGEVEDYLLTLYQPAPASSTISITNLTMVAVTNAIVRWQCDAALLTRPEACSNLVEATTNPAAWIAQRGLGTEQIYDETLTTLATSRFFRVVAPFVAP